MPLVLHDRRGQSKGPPDVLFLIFASSQYLLVMAPKPVSQWSVDNVCTWLSAIGLGSKAAPFKDNAVDGSLLSTLSAEDLSADLGLSNIQAKKVLHELEFVASLSSGGGGGGGDYYDEQIQQLQEELAAKDATIRQLQEELAAFKAPVQKAAPAASTHHATTHHQPPPPPRNEHHVIKGAAGGAAKGAVTGAVGEFWNLLSCDGTCVFFLCAFLQTILCTLLLTIPPFLYSRCHSWRCCCRSQSWSCGRSDTGRHEWSRSCEEGQEIWLNDHDVNSVGKEYGVNERREGKRRL